MDTKRILELPKASAPAPWQPRGVLVFLDDAREMVVDTAAELALERGGRLHLVASRGPRAKARLRAEAAKAFRFRIAVVPHVVSGRAGDLVTSVTEVWGPLTVVIDEQNDSRASQEQLGAVSDIDVAIVNGHAHTIGSPNLAKAV